jgi:hypothetical protein
MAAALMRASLNLAMAVAQSERNMHWQRLQSRSLLSKTGSELLFWID